VVGDYCKRNGVNKQGVNKKEARTERVEQAFRPAVRLQKLPGFSR